MTVTEGIGEDGMTNSLITTLSIIALVTVIFAKLDVTGQANAENDNSKKCDIKDQYSDSSANCSKKDSTPFIMPFP